jgi:ferredoxin-NADP reductase
VSSAEASYEIALAGREMAAERTMSFRFERPQEWVYRAGQSLDMTLLDPPETDAEGNKRAFTISSAPRENVIQITTRLRDSAFKRVLSRAPIGTRVKIEGPFGDFRLHRPARPAVLLAGGIGITPFRSMLVEAIGGGPLPYCVVLFHANRRPEDSAFADELRSLERGDSNLRFVPTMTAMAESAEEWDGERGRMDTAMLGRHTQGLISPIYYLAGPPGMVKAMRATLDGMGADEDDIRTEEFSGY